MEHQVFNSTPLTRQFIVVHPENHRIQLVHSVTGIVSTLAGNDRQVRQDDQGSKASFNWIFDIAFDPLSRKVIVGDNHGIRLIHIDTGVVTTFTKHTNHCCFITFDPLLGRILVPDRWSNLSIYSDCGLVGILDWEAHVKQVFESMNNDENSSVSFIPNVLIDIILYYSNYSYGRKQLKF
jgi:hypothetical protein